MNVDKLYGSARSTGSRQGMSVNCNPRGFRCRVQFALYDSRQGKIHVGGFRAELGLDRQMHLVFSQLKVLGLPLDLFCMAIPTNMWVMFGHLCDI